MFTQLVTPVELRPNIDPWRAWDLGVGGIHALLAAGIWWCATSGGDKFRRLLVAAGMGLMVAAGAWRWDHPVLGSWITVASLSLGVLLLVRREKSPLERASLLALAAAGWTGTTGPLAELLGVPHRLEGISPLGPLAAASLFSSALLATMPLFRTTPGLNNLSALRRSLILWLVLGIALAGIMSLWARRNFEQHLLARVKASAPLIDRDALAAVLGPQFRLDRLDASPGTPDRKDFYYSAFLAAQNPLRVSQGLSEIEKANPDAQWAMVLTLRSGLLVSCCVSNEMPGIPGSFGIYGLPDQATWDSWVQQDATVLGPVRFYYGDTIQARAPLISSERKMLGWLVLDFGVSHWLGAQLQARLLAFVVIFLGGAILVLGWWQRNREESREAARLEAANARAASQLKTAFLAKVSHELRTPIQSLLGYSELLRRHVTDDAKAALWLSSLQQHGELMTRLVNDLIDLSAVESGSFRLAPKVVPVGEVVRQTVESFRPRAEQLGLSLACFIDPAAPAAASLDGERFRQVLTNLIGNALKFTERGGVTVALQARAAAENKTELILVVRDTGPGIPPDQQHRLFVAFSRLEGTAAKEGSGLGLALSAALCGAMDGSLAVESDGVAGSVFTARFRAASAELFETRPSSRQAAGLRGRRVLVVDDNRLLRELFVAFLTEQGALCAAADTGREALTQAAANRFDAIILDLALPDGDSTSLVTPLRAQQPAQIRIIGVSAHASSADRARVLAAGMDAFLTKPVPLDVLAQAVASSPDAGKALDLSSVSPLLERLRQEFRRELPGQRSRMAAVIAAENWLQVHAQAHYLKNSAAVVRDDALFDICTGLEQAALDADAPAVQHWWTRCQARLDSWNDASVPFLRPPDAVGQSNP
ncbi:hybrid sensor histidine kinase/response regulator [Lacunisphaera limnophila]|nr:response regulator [Lacunisphaera limnophila]